MKKINVNFKGLSGYVLTVMLMVCFALVLNAQTGYLMLYIFAVAPILSFAMTYISSKCIEVKIILPEGYLGKKNRCSTDIIINNKSILFIPFVVCNIKDTPSVSTDMKECIISLKPRGKKKVSIIFTARFCGKSKIGIDSIVLSDFLGVFMIEIPVKSNEGVVYVIPDVADISMDNEIIRQLLGMSNNASDGDDTKQSNSIKFGGFPGYDLKEYVPGDPLKRINWKQSAKKGKLFVRPDDEVSGKSVYVVIDGGITESLIDPLQIMNMTAYDFYKEEEILPEIMEETVESTLGIIRLLVNNDYSVQFIVKLDKHFEMFSVCDEKDLEDIRIKMAAYEFGDENSIRIPDEQLISDSERVMIVVTCVNDAALVDTLKAMGDVVIYPVLDDIRK